MKSILSQYKADVASGLIEEDEYQKKALEKLQKIYDEILLRYPDDSGLLVRTKAWFLSNFKSVKGLYLWGGVGRGKTYILDLFFDALPIQNKLRMHFHRFMLRVHKQLAALEGFEDPLSVVANEFAKEAKVICFDEFYVSDISDAMILGTLLKYLFSRNVIVIFTSNVHPDDLYEKGLQRQRFLKSIDVIKNNNDIFEVDSGVDYRFKVLVNAGVYYLDNEPNVFDIVKSEFMKLAPVVPCWDVMVNIDNREVQTIAVADDIIWFNFKDICEGARSSSDYIEIASCYHTVIVSEVPILNEGKEDSARRFIALVDELYDRAVNLIIVAASNPEELYKGRLLKFQFKRTASRLIEMSGHEYLSKAHNP